MSKILNVASKASLNQNNETPSLSSLSKLSESNPRGALSSNIYQRLASASQLEEPTQQKKPATIVKLKKRNPSPATTFSAPPKQEIYGLDVEFLKELNLGDMIQDMIPTSSLA